MSKLTDMLQKPGGVAATHSGAFHADDVMAAAAMRLMQPELTILRSRDQDELDTADIQFDVGRVYDPSICRFDHHQLDYKEARDNGIPYSSFGLIWRELGAELCGSADAARRVDVALVQGVDAMDCGVTISKEIRPVRLMSVSAVLGSFNPGWQDTTTPAAMTEAFEQAVTLGKTILQNIIREASGYEKAKEIVEQGTLLEQGHLLLLSHGVPWKEAVFESGKYKKLLYVVYPDAQAKWHVSCVPEAPGSFGNRKPLPAAWAGLDGEELDKVTGIAGCVFCHRARFVGAHKTKDGAIEMVKLALKE